ncbi:J domain-containing protein [Pseudarthrobacter sp. RMG13]|uniref:J domain-containing protein n=1 Tax=Pseudarthrobacter humi TaxID=2952523 RepID=A0ABT1LRP1_9MICC|nr:J domain-containing protein [Pseudarthrobacter humi]MCP9001130.1 J domain-containing protein [Pseudarthrobacter humi]
MTTQPDYYDVLRVKPAASQQEISRAYRVLMRTHHPDLDGDATDGAKAGGDPTRAELLRIMQAFAVLRDPARRAAYDRSRTGINAQGAGPVVIPVRIVNRRDEPVGNTIRITPVRWESGPWT